MTWIVSYDIGPCGGREVFENEEAAHDLYEQLSEDLEGCEDDEAYVEIWEE